MENNLSDAKKFIKEKTSLVPGSLLSQDMAAEIMVKYANEISNHLALVQAKEALDVAARRIRESYKK